MKRSLVWTLISIVTMAVSLPASYLLDNLLRESMLEGILHARLTPPLAAGALANVVLPLMVAVMAVSLLNASEATSLPGFLYLLTGVSFTLLPLAMSLSRPLMTSSLLGALPFHPMRLIFDLNAPLSRMYFLSGFLVVLGIIGLVHPFRRFLANRSFRPAI